MITSAKGNLLDADVDALVNTVNTVGVMGKGIALQFKKAYPEMFKDYARACKNGEVRLGRMHVWATGVFEGPRFIINFPTKGHWRNSSKLRDIEAGLHDLVAVIQDLDISSIAVPPLGCGNGGLVWDDVEPLIKMALEPLESVAVKVYAPEGAPAPAKMVNATTKPELNVNRAVLIALLARYARLAIGATPIELQKLMYITQVLGQPLNLRFEKNLYGPYADNLRHVLNRLEGHYITGFGDQSSRVLEAEAITPVLGAEELANEYLAKDPEAAERVEAVMDAIDGFESRYGMELLATVHWVMAENVDAAADWRATAADVHEWTHRKKKLFSEDHIQVAWNALRDRGLIQSPS